MSTQQQVTVRDLVEEAKKRIVFLAICIVGLAYLMSCKCSIFVSPFMFFYFLDRYFPFYVIALSCGSKITELDLIQLFGKFQFVKCDVLLFFP